MDVILICGVPGVGKTTLLKKLKEKNLKCISFGEEMIKMAEKESILKKARWKMHDLPRKQIDLLENLVVNKILRNKGLVLLESHLLIAAEHGFYDGFPERIYRKLPIKKIIILEGKAEEIRKRRARGRKKMSELPRYRQSINKHQQLDRKKAKKLAEILNINFFVVESKKNQFGKIRNLILD